MCLRKQPPSGLYAVCGDSLASNQSQHADSKAGWCSFHDCGTGTFFFKKSEVESTSIINEKTG